jgi:hypothetical protein
MFINEDYIKKPTNPLKIDGVSYSNPSDETLLTLGYLPLETLEKLEEKEGYIVIPKYVKKTDKIVNEWKYYEVLENEFA